MRTIATAALLATGCNQVFGLEKTSVADAPPPTPARIRLTYQVAETDPAGNPIPTPRYAEIPDVHVRFGPVDGELQDATYDPTGGFVEIPKEMFGTAWRFEYTIANGPTHEVEWSPLLQGDGHITIPVFGRLERAPVPPDSGYAITTDGFGDDAPYALPHVLTTGIWTITKVGDSSGSPVNLAFATVNAISGPGQPESSKNDGGVFVAYTADAKCNAARGTATFAPPPLQGSLSPVVADWIVQTNSSTAFNNGPSGTDPVRLRTALGDRSGTQTSRVHAGVGPHDAMPLLTEDHLRSGIPSPPVLSLVDCVFGTTTPTSFADLPLFAFPRIGYGHFEEERIVSGIKLKSSVTAAATLTATNNTFNFDFRIPIAIAPIELVGSTAADLAGTQDQVALPGGTDPLRLAFGLEALPGGVVDYFDVTLYKLVGSGIELVRSYTITDPSQRELRVDRSVFSSGEFVFAISAHRGRPQIASGDFTVTTFPQAVSRVFTRTIAIP